MASPKLAGTDAQAGLHAIRNALAVLEPDPDLNVLGGNENLCRALGYEAREIQDPPHSRLLPRDDADGDEHHRLSGKLRSGVGWSGTHPRLTRGDHELWLKVIGRPVRDARGQLVKFIELYSDPSTSQAALEERKAELKLRSDITDLFSLVSESDKRGHILDANEKNSEISKSSNAELIGSGHNINRHPDVPKAVSRKCGRPSVAARSSAA